MANTARTTKSASSKPATPSQDVFQLDAHLDEQESRHAADRRVERARLGELQDEIGMREKNIERLSGAIAQINATREAAGIDSKPDAEAEPKAAPEDKPEPADKV